MIVYGDRAVVRASAEIVDELRAGVEALAPAGPGLERHAALVALLLSAGELAQGLADRVFEEDGRDRRDPGVDAAMRVAVAIGRRIWRSHRAWYRGDVGAQALQSLVARLERATLPRTLVIKTPEGFRHYAVYPEAYAAAAATAVLAGRRRPLVVGIRTIGAPLSAMAAAVLRGREIPLTVRPVGPPFERRLALAPELASALAAARGRGVAVVDEGPGLSGSSFGAVLDALADVRVAERNIHLFPSHPGAPPGASARARWARLGRHVVSFEELFLAGAGPGLRAWTEELTGPQDQPPEDIGAGRWRARVFDDPRRWPPVWTWRERRKYLLFSGGRTFVARFLGLGAGGRAAHARARALARAGFAPPVRGVAHGFLVQPWLDEARRLPEGGALVSRSAFLATVGEYLCHRAVERPASHERGASPRSLLEMAVANVTEALGEKLAARLARFERWVDDLARARRPMEIDGRLHPWEWLICPDGRVLKADAIDHCDGHDLIGCQDAAWDMAGASVELDLDAYEERPLRRRLARSGAPMEPEPLAFYRVAYLAFQLGLHRMGAAAEGASAEGPRLARAARRYERLLARELTGPGTRARR